VLKPASPGATLIETSAKIQATAQIGMATSLELWSSETYKTETKGNTMKLEHKKTSGISIKFQVKALAFVAFAWLAFGIGAELA